MISIRKLILKIKLKISSPSTRAEIMSKYCHSVGKNVLLYTTDFGTEPYLIHIDDNVICAANVSFVTHDMSVVNIARYLQIPRHDLDKVGPIHLKQNCFVGTNTILMPGCSVGINSIVAAGSVVTKQIPDNEVWGGVPARYIMPIKEYANKVKHNADNYPWIASWQNMKNNSELVLARINYFFPQDITDTNHENIV